MQRLYIVLSPGADARHDTESGTHKKRVIIIGHKSLPVVRSRDMFIHRDSTHIHRRSRRAADAQ